MRVLVFDTETTGLPTDRRAPPSKTDCWPHIVQLAYILYDVPTNTIVAESDELVSLPTGVTMSEGSIAQHGISEAQLRRKGVDVVKILADFTRAVQRADRIVAHNLDFDWKVVEAACCRAGVPSAFATNPVPYCTARNGVPLCAIWADRANGSRFLRFPKLWELHEELFDDRPGHLHDALADVLICLRSYVRMAHEDDLMRCPRARALYKLYAISETQN